MIDRAEYTQVRIARPTDKLDKIIRFYHEGLGLEQIGKFEDHDGYSGVMLGMPDVRYHLEFTSHTGGSPCPAPTKDNLLVFYFDGSEKCDSIVKRLLEMGYPEVEPENPYWSSHGITIEDPDGWRVVLMGTPAFTVKS